MLPTKGYFQDIECPFYNSSCGRPYCHFRHRRKPNENIEENLQETTKSVVPTYKPTPKSELANIHNIKSHIPISYVPDLAFKRERTVRPVTRIEKPTYKPTPLSLLSSATKLDDSLPENHEHKETIKDIQENIASNVYDPLKSEINFEDLSSEFDLIDEIINEDGTEPQSSITDNLSKIANDIQKEQTRLSLLQSKLESCEDVTERNNDEVNRFSDKNVTEKESVETKISDENCIKKEENKDSVETKIGDKNCENVEIKIDDKNVIKKDKIEKSSNKSKSRKSESKLSSSKSEKHNEKDIKSSSKEKSQKSKEKSESKDKHSSSKERTSKVIVKEKSSEKGTKSHKSSEREKHRKEERKESSKDKHKSRDKSKSPRDKKSKKKNRTKSSSTSSSSSNESTDREKDKHRKEKKKDSSKSKRKHRSRSRHKEKVKKVEDKSKSRSRSRSLSKSKSKLKSRHRSRSNSRHKEKDRNRKSKERNESKEKSVRRNSKSSEDRKEKRKKLSTSESGSINGINDIFSNEPMDMDDIVPSDIDLDLEDEDETMRECYKIFNEYKPEPIQVQPKVEEVEKKDLFEDDASLYHGKKRTAHAGADISSAYPKIPPAIKPKVVSTPGQVLTNRYKIAKLAQATNEQENIMNEIKQITRQPPKRPATSLLEAARLHQLKRVKEQKLKEEKNKKTTTTNVVDSILNGDHRPGVSQFKGAPKKIAAVPNVALIEKAKERISLIKQQRAQATAKTVAQTQKSGRVAHVPEFSLADIPDVLQAEKSKLPVNVRTRFLTMIGEECLKLYASRQDAYTRALNEEFACYEKCKVLATYRNSAMLAVNRIRKEFQERDSKGLGLLLTGETTTSDKGSNFKGRRFYENVKKWILTEEELDVHGYPKESAERGRATINNRKNVDYSIVDENQRKCSRCSKIYQVDDDGWPLFEEECMYHPMKKRTIRGEQVFLCCKSNDDMGCVTSDTHVFDGLESYQLEGFQTTLPPESDDDPRSIAVYALDCEMCYTTRGLELTRVTIVDTDCKTVYESLVKPLNPIIDYNTRFSGITKEQMDKTSTSILQIQANILHLCNSATILVGHSLESDMKALKIVHSCVIDTSVLYPHKMGLPHKRSLKALASEHLKKIIQNDVSGHDSAEDAVTCMELIKWKLKEELKVRTK